MPPVAVLPQLTNRGFVFSIYNKFNTPVPNRRTPVLHFDIAVQSIKTTITNPVTPVAASGTHVAKFRIPVAASETPVPACGTPVANLRTPVSAPGTPVRYYFPYKRCCCISAFILNTILYGCKKVLMSF